jgi:hypothetical protein
MDLMIKETYQGAGGRRGQGKNIVFVKCYFFWEKSASAPAPCPLINFLIIF